ncbi:LysR family transcriptional regulator [Chelativorans sp. ZYF759]|uniref:LysR family transcriptional regulator n=1 Tax=Chelativorans sp. ZYF759 TaxID=2692213 RepID=UPI00145E9084|nr:LysR family transcriptional regulator [Chelativorans sp. ZYF759]NMG37857.1 LysR family transcriptional regulator [Chelativorans sp. ZYF759]
MNLTLRQLRAFHEVAQTRSFTAAARRMNLTQSAVSMLVRQLEKELGMVLFNRYQRAAQLTEIGEHMLPVTERIMDDLRQIEEGATSLRMLSRGKLQLAVPQMLACSWLPPLVVRYRELHRDVVLNVTDTTGDRIVTAVLQNEAELGIGPMRPTPPGVHAEKLWDEPIQIVCAAGSKLAGNARLKWSALRGENWIQYSDDFSLHLERTAWAEYANSLPRKTHVRYLSTALALVGKGIGVTAAPRYARHFAVQFGVAFVEAHEPSLSRAFYLYTRRGQKLSPAASAFREMLNRPDDEDAAVGMTGARDIQQRA